MNSKNKSFRYKRIILILLIALALSIPSYYTIKPAPYRPQGFQAIHEINDLPRVIAHKSKTGQSLPNSRAALEQILSTDIEAIEIDVRMSKDGIPIIYHGTDLSELTKENILTLEEAFQIIGNKKYIFLDVKDTKIFSKEMVNAISRLIDKYKLNKTVIIESFNPFFLYKMRKVSPFSLIMYDFVTETKATAEESQDQLDSIPWLLKQSWFLNWINWSLKPDILGPRFSVPLKQLRELSSRGYPLIAWTVDEKNQATRLFNNGVHGIQTNRAEALSQEIKESAPSIISDAGRSNKANVTFIRITNENDIKNALKLAKETKKEVSLAGRRHTQGGHTFSKDNIVLDMKGYDHLTLLPDNKTLRAQSGATWSSTQRFLNQHGLSVKIMQSDNIFTIGGTVSVNAHGWQVGMPPICSTVNAFRLMLENGDIVECDRQKNKELFDATLGGYGLMGIILDIDIQTEKNYQYQSNQWVFKADDFLNMYKQEVTNNPKVDLAYGRLSVSKNNLLETALLRVYYRDQNDTVSNAPIESEKFVPLKQKIFRNSQRNEASKAFRWQLEKNVGHWLEAHSISRNNVMSPDIHVLWPLDMSKYDILHEYFIPQEKYMAFISVLKEAVLEHDMNLLNVTIREVRQDRDTVLNYATQDMFAFVLYFSQDKDELSEARMQAFTEHLIDHVLKLEGTFYLPYRPHYTQEQFDKAYPKYNEFIKIKKKVDPQERFTNQFYLRYLKQD